MTRPPHAGDAGAPLVIAVEATRLAHDVRGIGRYVRAVLPRLLAERPGVRLVLFARRGDVGRLAATYAADPATRGRVDVRPIGAMRGARADVFWYPWNIARPAPRRGAVVATVHDVAPVALPDPRPSAERANRRWRRLFAATAGRATVLVVDSAFTGDEVHRLFGVPHDRMRVVHLAADDALPPPPDGDDAALARLGVRRPFVLAVGAAERRKNHAVLERALPRVVARLPELTLVLAGPRRDAAAGDPPWQRTLGFVSEAELAALYRAAACLVMPSTYEGFGLPVLEAMQLGTPVVCARAASLPEVGGDAVAWVEPDDDAQLAAAIARVASDESVRATMRDAGRARAARFTWSETARRTLAAFDDAVALHRSGFRPPAAGGWRESLGALRIRLQDVADAVSGLARRRR